MILRNAARNSLTLAGIRTSTVVALYIAAIVQKSPEVGMIVYLFNFYEWWGLHHFYDIISVMGGYEGAFAVALFGLIIFADTFVAVFLVCGIAGFIRWVRE